MTLDFWLFKNDTLILLVWLKIIGTQGDPTDNWFMVHGSWFMVDWSSSRYKTWAHCHMCTGGFISAKQTGHSSSFLVKAMMILMMMMAMVMMMMTQDCSR